MKKMIVGILAVMALVAGLGVYQNLDAEEKRNTSAVIVHLQNGKAHQFDLEVARTAIEHEIGLMHRKSLPKDGGMIFLMGQPPRHTAFWMRNTEIPLDMIFVGEDAKIANIHHNAQPHDLTPVPSAAPVIAVIEINGGRSAELGLAPGDRVESDLF
jgi:hypothetical protein